MNKYRVVKRIFQINRKEEAKTEEAGGCGKIFEIVKNENMDTETIVF